MADMKSTPNTPDARNCLAGPGCPPARHRRAETTGTLPALALEGNHYPLVSRKGPEGRLAMSPESLDEGRPERTPKLGMPPWRACPTGKWCRIARTRQTFQGCARMPLAHDGTGPGGDTQASARDGGLARAALRRCDAGTALPTARWFWCDLRDSTLDEVDGRVILRW